MNSAVVVGGAGFLGSHVVEELVRRGVEAVAVDDLTSGFAEFVPEGVALEVMDITAPGAEDALRTLLRGRGGCFNYAAAPYVPDSYCNPARVLEINANGALTVMEACRKENVPLLQVSSAEVYGEGSCTGENIPEEAPVAPRSSYGASKAAVDALVRARWKEARSPTVALRQFNCVGARETHPYVVPEIITQLHRGDGVSVMLGNNTVRDFMAATDAASAAVDILSICAERGLFGETFNLGSESAVRVYSLAQELAALMGCGTVTVVKDPARLRAWDIWLLLSDNTRVGKLLGRDPAPTPLRVALNAAVQWFLGRDAKWPWEK